MLDCLDKLDQLERKIDRALAKPLAAAATPQRQLTDVSLLQLVPLLTPGAKEPTPLAPIASLIERADVEPVRGLFSVPRQHGKTTLIVHGLVWLAIRHPAWTHAYITYSQDRANEISRTIVRTLRAAGIETGGTQKRIELAGGGSIYCTGIDGAITGRGISGLAIVDDPHKNREEANSVTVREKVHQAFQAIVASGLHESGSVGVVHTRWHQDDLYGRLEQLLEDDGETRRFRAINLAAVNDAGEALWPELRSLRHLQQIRKNIGEYEWWSLFMGAPRPIGSTVFRDVQFYDALPERYRVGIGFDCAATAKTSSDYHAAVVLAVDEEDRYYVLDVIRIHATLPQFIARLRALAVAYPGARMRWDASAQERATADVVRELLGLPVIGELATADKLVRAQPVAAAWNGSPESPGMPARAGRVFLPRSAPWLSAFVSEVCGFTGNDRHDDQVDALASAYQLLHRSNVVELPRAFPSKFEGFEMQRQRGPRFQW